jgi:fluoride ion exporter CrcB/FEX
MARYLLSLFVLRASGSLFPLGTFAVDFIGCILFGAILLGVWVEPR